MKNSIVYLIFTISLLTFILVYMFVPTEEIDLENTDYISENEIDEIERNMPPIISGIKYVNQKYEGDMSLDNTWTEMNLVFTKYIPEIVQNDLSAKEYYESENIEKIFGISEFNEFEKLYNSFKEFGNIVQMNILEDTVENTEDSIKFNMIVYNEKYEYRFYMFTIYNKYDGRDVLYKIEPYMEVEE